jgi:hypothetical protein
MPITQVRSALPVLPSPMDSWSMVFAPSALVALSITATLAPAHRERFPRDLSASVNAKAMSSWTGRATATLAASTRLSLMVDAYAALDTILTLAVFVSFPAVETSLPSREPVPPAPSTPSLILPSMDALAPQASTWTPTESARSWS